MLAVELDGTTWIRVLGEEGSPGAWYPLSQFEIVDGSLPGNWQINVPRPGMLVFEPLRWATPGFWERLIDGDPNAHSIFEDERRKIIGECEQS